MSAMHPGGAAWRHIRSDRSVVDNRIDPGTVRRVLGFARPHRRLIAVFLGLTVVDAAMVVVMPLLVLRIVDDGILAGNGGLVTKLALAMAGVVIFNAVLAVLAGWLSSRIGEGLIFDLRTKVFGHVQRQSLAFFTRTQTGALVSRLNNDVIGAQRAFTSTLSSTVSNSIAVVVVGIAMLALSWQVTLMCLALFPMLFLVSRWVGGRLAGLTRRQMDGNADLGNLMTERFNVGGAMLLKLFGRRAEEDELFADKAAVVRDLGVRISLITRIFGATMMAVPALATAMVYGFGGHLAISGTLTVGTLLALATLLLRLLGPLQGLSNVRIDIMTALVSFERVFEVLDLPSLIQEKHDAFVLPKESGRLEFEHVSFTYPRADEISLGSLESVARAESRDNTPGAQRRGLRRRAWPDGGPGRPLRCRQDHGHQPRGPALRRRQRRRAGRWPRRARRDAAVARGRGRLRHPGRPHVPRHHPGQPALRATRTPPTRRRGAPSRRPRSPRWCAASPTGWTPSSATAATGSPAASVSGWRSPGCCSRRPRSWCSTRRPPTSTASRRRPCSARSTRRWRAVPPW